ncbi:hypothetical protein BC629DRAFT_1473133 [Irpex lacteus]|nr:hypothetical protein BC629DRAFT_1473133 [Irpex lacteus]
MSDINSSGLGYGYNAYGQDAGTDRRGSQYSSPYNPTPPQRAPTMPIPSSGGFSPPRQTHGSASPYHIPSPAHSQPWPHQTHNWTAPSPFESSPPSTPYTPGGLVSVAEGAPMGYHGAHYTPYQPGYDTGTHHPHAPARAETMPFSTRPQFSSSPPTVSGFGGSGLVSTEPQSYIAGSPSIYYTPQTYGQPSGISEYSPPSEYPHPATSEVPHRSATFSGTALATTVVAFCGHVDTGEHRARPSVHHGGKHKLPKDKPQKPSQTSNVQPTQPYQQPPPQPYPSYQYPPHHQTMPPRPPQR